MPGAEQRASPPLLAIALKPSVERDVIVRAQSGRLVRGARESSRQLKAIDARARGTIDGSLYLSAKAAGVPESVIIDLIRIYSYDVDFQREMRAGDKFDLLYTNYVDETGETRQRRRDPIRRADAVAASSKPLYRFTTSDDQATDYFTPKG